MDFLTLVGYFIAALAIAFGLYLILRKSVAKDSQTEQFDAEDLEGIEFFDDDTGRIPVIPRHAREQLGAEALSGSTDASNNESILNSQAQFEADNGTVDESHSGHYNHNDTDLLEQASHIKPAKSRENFDDEIEAEPDFDNTFDNTFKSQSETRDQAAHVSNSHAANNHQLNSTEPNELLMQQGSHLVDSSRPDQEPAEDMFDQALAQLEAATTPENNLEKYTGNDDHQTTELSDSVASEITNADKQTANVEDWEGESALLDAHIEDQERRDDESALAQAEHIVALYVMPAASRTLSGERTIELLRQFGLRYGEMSLFHRFLEADGTGPLMFSVLRYTSEGPLGFDLEALPNEQVEGLAFFLALPSNHAAAGYDTMVSISTLLSREIKGQVCDEYMNELSPQLREHYRHFVLEYRTPD